MIEEYHFVKVLQYQQKFETSLLYTEDARNISKESK